MESEKVKEIKKALEHNAYFAIEYFPKAGKPSVFKLDDILTLINELESENKEVEEQCVRWTEIVRKKDDRIKKLKDRIAELEKEKTEQLKQFAERLKEISCEMYLKKQLHWCIDETLKEFINE